MFGITYQLILHDSFSNCHKFVLYDDASGDKGQFFFRFDNRIIDIQDPLFGIAFSTFFLKVDK